MSLTTANPMEIIKKQFVFKLRANIDAFSSLIGIQLLGLFFSLIGGVGSSGSFSSGLTIEAKYYSADLVIVFSIIWGFVTAITITTKPYRNHDFTYITNRTTSSVSNILFLFASSFIAGITAMLSRYLLLMVEHFFYKQQLYGSLFTGKEFFIGVCVTVLYISLASSIGYLVGTLVQVHKIFVVFIPVLFIGALILDAIMQSEPFSTKLFAFYFMESNLVLFIMKVLLTVTLLFLSSISLLNRMEVRR